MQQNNYNFTAQEVFTLPATTDKVFAAPDKLLVSSLTKSVLSILDLGDRGFLTHDLETQGVVQRAQYCAANNHIATIEDNHIFVYQSWWSNIKVKSFGYAERMSWCQTTGRLAVFDSDKIRIYEELLPLFEITGLTNVEDVYLCENILVVRSFDSVIILNVDDVEYETLDNEVIWNFDRLDFVINGKQLSSIIKNNNSTTSSEISEDLQEVYLPDRPIHGLNIEIKNICNDNVYQARVVLFKRTRASYIALIPYHSCDETDQQNPLAPSSGIFEFATVLIADTLSCNIYCVKGAKKHGCVEFQEKAESIAVDECFMHVLSTDSLLTYSIPIPGLSKDWTPLLLSKHLMNMKSLLMSRDHLVVLSDRNLGDITIYSLLKPTTSEFYADIRSSNESDAHVRGDDVVRLQIRIHGKRCSERLLALYDTLDKDEDSTNLEIILNNSGATKRQIEEVVLTTHNERLVVDGNVTDLGEKLLSKHPEMLELLLTKCEHISPKVLRSRMISASSLAEAKLILSYVCSRLNRRIDDEGRLYKKFITKNIPEWFYELPPFEGVRPQELCKNNHDCLCLYCSANLLHAAVIVASASKLKIELLKILPRHAPDSMRLACLLPMSKSSSANVADYSPSGERIISIAVNYTHTQRTPHLLTTLSDVLPLGDFLKCIPENEPYYLPWVENGLMRQRANKLKQEIVSLGDELRPMLP